MPVGAGECALQTLEWGVHPKVTEATWKPTSHSIRVITKTVDSVVQWLKTQALQPDTLGSNPAHPLTVRPWAAQPVSLGTTHPARPKREVTRATLHRTMGKIKRMNTRGVCDLAQRQYHLVFTNNL